MSTRIELTAPALAVTPIFHQRYYRGERELFGYAPSFMPNVVTFDEQNRPYMRTGTKVQSLHKKNGPWEVEDLAPIIAAHYPNWDGDASNLSDRGYYVDERVVFDEHSDAYTFLDTAVWKGVGVPLLLYRPHGHQAWQVYVPPTTLRFGYGEYADGGNDRSELPVFLFTNYFGPTSRGPGPLDLVVPRHMRDGTLSFAPTITLATDALPQVRGAGGSNTTATIGDSVHIVWASATSGAAPGTPTYITTYSRRAGRVIAGPLLLGYGGVGKPDAHNIPAITVDSKGYLHVVLGAHHEQFKYTRSLQPNDINGGFTSPLALGARKPGDPTDPANPDPECYYYSRCYYYTYVSLACDLEDTLHIVARWAGDTKGYTYYFRLAYLRKKADADWEPRRTLVVPFKAYYSNWYQKLAVDRRGRLFLNYRYYGDQLFAEEVEAYRAKWPADGLVADDPTCIPTSVFVNPKHYCDYSRTVRAHDPVVLISDDGGDSFRVATTADFAPGFPVPTVGISMAGD